MRLPHPVPELPVSDVQAAGKSYARLMGFDVNRIRVFYDLGRRGA